jgi:hypothetical protein
MTCVVGLVEGNDVFIGADSAGVAGLSIAVRADEKVFRNGEFVFGFTTSFRMGQLLRYRFSPPDLREGQSIMAYMVTDFIDAVRATMADGGFLHTDNGRISGGNFLVGFRGRLFEIDEDFQVGERLGNFAAVGCGSDLALGSLFSTPRSAGPISRITTALGAAASFSAGVCAPFCISSTRMEYEDVPE